MNGAATFDIAEARRRLSERERARTAALDRRYEAACRDARAIIRMLIEKHRPSRIFQWGSLLDRRTFWQRSDIDIAIEGIDRAEEIFQIYGDVMEMTDFPVDIVQIEKLPKEFADIIRLKGRVVYERHGAAPGPG